MLTAQLVFVFLILHFAILRGEKLFQYVTIVAHFTEIRHNTQANLRRLLPKRIFLKGSRFNMRI